MYKVYLERRLHAYSYIMVWNMSNPIKIDYMNITIMYNKNVYVVEYIKIYLYISKHKYYEN